MEDEKVEEVKINKELDSDQDGLPDYIEKVLGTNLNNSDTDGDSYSDFEEIKNGYDPVGDGKYTEEEWEAVEEKIRNEDENLYTNLFIVNWKTYQNEKYGFSFKYPYAWIVNDSNDALVLSNYDNGFSSGQIKPDYVELRFTYSAKLSSQSHDNFFENFIELLSKSVPYLKDKNNISGISFGNKKYLHVEGGIISLYSCEFFSNRVITVFIINDNLEMNNIKRVLSTVKMDKSDSVCMLSISNNETICNVNIDNIFELFEEPYFDSKKCPDISPVSGGCFLKDIFYDKEYVEKLEVESKKENENGCWGKRIYRFKAIKRGNTEIISTGTCDYDMKYKIEIK